MYEDVCVLIPTLNEETTIGPLIAEFKELGFNNILVIDGNSNDDTATIAKDAGAKVIVQSGKGKGQAVQEAFEAIKDRYVLMIDGDGTYLPSDAPAMVEPLMQGNADHVMGNRFANYEPTAFTKLNLIGNKMLNKLFGFAYGEWLTDILSGYRAFTHEAIKGMELNKTGFEIETEITVELVKNDFRIKEVPITYLSRHSLGKTKLNPLKDGLKIGLTIYKLAKSHNPMFYFGIIGAIFVGIGTVTGIYVVGEWLNSTTHILLAVLTTLMILIGVQLFIFGLIGDLIASLHRETMRTIRNIRNK